MRVMISEALVFTDIQKVELREFEFPSPEAGEAVVQTLYTLISPGTELRCLAGKEFASFPFIPGYSAVGRILESGPGCRLPVGQLVYHSGTKKANIPLGWGAHCRHALVPEKRLFPLPAPIMPLQALPATLTAISYHGAKIGRAQAQEKVAVVGLGPIGYLAVLCHRLSGAATVGIDIDAWRVKCMETAGAPARVSRDSVASAVEDFFGQRADMVVDATGVAAAFAQCVDAVKPLSWEWNEDTDHGARILVQGSYAGDLSFSYRETFAKELKILLTRNHTENDLREVIGLIHSGKLDVAGVISDVVPPQKASEAYQRLLRKEEGLLTIAFQWDS